MPTDSSPLDIHGIRDFLLSRLAESLGVPRDEVDPRAPLHRLGLDSVKATALVAALSKLLGRTVPVTLLWDHPTPEELCRALAQGPDDTGAAADGTARPARTYGPQEPVALVGIACRLPGAPDPASYWRLLVDGGDAVDRVRPARRALGPDDVAPSFRWGGYLDDIDMFDPLFFGISPREAVAMDPQQRLVLELAWEALEDAGVPPGGLVGSDTGVFMGSSWSDYAAMAHQSGSRQDIGPHTATGTHDSIIANRVSYTLGLQGPSMAVDTACSASLVAVHLACQAIRGGESELVLAGGVNLSFFTDHFLAMDQIGALSSDGRIKAFDARADGAVRSEGAAVVVLAPLRVALERGLPVYCLIRGSAVNNDGLSNGLTAPNPRAQEALLRTAYRRAGVAPDLVDYVECHGTGTPLGDPIEAKALGTVLGRGRAPEDALRIGSVKTNIGHLEPAAGIAGLVKVALALRNGVLPASLHYTSPNPRIPFAEAGLRVQDRTTPWPRRSDVRRAGVSAFGFGGTNCHVVAEEFPQVENSLLLLGEDSAQALADRVTALRAELDDDTPADLPALCREESGTRGSGRFRLAATADDRAELRAQLDAFTAGRPHPGLATGQGGEGRPRVAFLCSGTGSQWVGMGRRLLAGMPAFRRSLLRSDARIRELAGFSVVDELLADAAHTRLDDMEIVQPLLFSLQIGLADAWRSLGVEPDVVLGQSIGEFAAAHVAGALHFDDATLLAVHHARLVQRLAVGRGDTMVVAADEERVAPHLAAVGGDLTVAGHNGPTSLLVSGGSAELQALTELLTAEGVTCHRVRMGYASHSPQVEPVLEPLRAALEGIRPVRPRVPLISTVTGELIGPDDLLGPEYWTRNVRSGTKLMRAVCTLAEQGVDAVVELSPHPVLLKPVRETLDEREVRCLPSLQRGVDDGRSMFRTLGELHAAGLPVTVGPSASGTRGRHLEPGRRAALTQAGQASVTTERTQLVPVTAHSEQALLDSCRALSQHVERDGGLWLPDLAHTLAERRTHHRHRVAILARDRQDLLDGLARVSAGEPDPAVTRGVVEGHRERRVAFVFSGSGTQWPGMGRELLQWHTGFRERMEECDAAVRTVTGWSVLDEMLAPPQTSRLYDGDIQQPVLFALQVSLARLWTDLGVAPVALVGHSVGEVAAACVGGALSLEDGARIAAARSHLIQHEAGRGAMIVVERSEDLLPLLARYEGEASIAAYNSPTSVAVSGAPDAIRALEEELRRAGTSTRALRVERAGHSVLMDPILAPLREAIRDITPLPFEVPFHSTALDGAVDPRVDADYWAHNLRNPVRFSPVVAALVEDGVDTFVEIGPHGTLRGAVEETALAQGTSVHVVDSLRRGESDTRSLLGSVASLFTHGVPLSWTTLFPDGARVVETPLVSWQKERYWLGTSTARESGGVPAETPQPTTTGTAPADTAAPQATRDVVLGEIADMLGIPVRMFEPATRLQDFGLDSMLAIRLSNRMQTLFGHRVSPVEFLNGSTVEDMLERILELVGRPEETVPHDGAVETPADDRPTAVAYLSDEDAEELLTELVARKLLDPPAPDSRTPARESLRAALESEASFEVAPTGHGQASIWFMQQLSPDGVAYNLMCAARVRGTVDERALEQAVAAVVERHPALRTSFVEAGGRPHQLIWADPVYEFLTEDGSGLDDEELRDLLMEHGHVPLDLDQGPVFRVVLVSREAGDDYLLLVIHHVAADAASVDVVVRDLREFYGRALHGDLPPQEPVAPYTDFVAWEEAWLRGPQAEEALRWWADSLAAPPAHLDLPPRAGAQAPAKERPAGVSYAGADVTFRWTVDEARRLREFAVREGVSLSTLVLAGFFATLNRFAGAEDAVVATAIAQRGEAGRESAVGYYLNTALVRARPGDESSFRGLLQEVHAFSLGLLEHMNYPLDLLVSELNPPRVDGRSPWFDFAVNWLSGDAFTYANTLFHGAGEAEEPSGALPLVPVPLRRHIAKFDLEITMADVSDEVVGQVQYKPSLMERGTVTSLLECFHSVLFQSIDRPELPIAQLSPGYGSKERDL
jgi:acyl transferase domain-containing protein